MTLDDKGRCCGRKPIYDKGGGWPFMLCFLCNRKYDAKTGEQRENWAWVREGDRFVPRRPDQKVTR